MKIAVVGTGYVGMSMATLLSVNNTVYAVDIVPEKVEKINKETSILSHITKTKDITDVVFVIIKMLTIVPCWPRREWLPMNCCR